MKISYKVLQNYISWIKHVDDVAKDLIMHTAEVEDILLEWQNLEKVIIWKIKSVEKHPDSERLNCTIVEVNWKEFEIVCWASNVKEWMKVPVALCWAELKNDFVITKTVIRWKTSEWMICSEDELWLIEERQEWILELPHDAPLNVSMRDYLEKNDAILEIDNKAINHRPDLFSHIWIIREIYAINSKKFDYEYIKKDFSSLPSLWIKNDITSVVKRYIWLKIENVSNSETPKHILQVLNSAWVKSKWLLVDITNYSLYLYWQPTHCFDADKIKWNINIRFAKNWEKFVALDNFEYELSWEDIVIADEEKILALWWIIWWKDSSVSETTTSIIVEWAHFDQAIIRKTWKKLWVRTDALNVFEKDIIKEMSILWVSLIEDELKKVFPNLKTIAYSDIYPDKENEITVPLDIDFINNLIWSSYKKEEVLKILNNLWIIEKNNILSIPFWRKDIRYKADIAEEIARIDWYDKIVQTVPRINLWAIIQPNTYKIKNDARNYFTDRWFFDMYTYSFVNEELMTKLNSSLENLVPIKNVLSEELSHMRWSIIPNLILSLERNRKEFDNLKLFEIEKVFKVNNSIIEENYSLAWVQIIDKEIAYYDIQNEITNFFCSVWVYEYKFDLVWDLPKYTHSWRTAKIFVEWVEVWILWEIHPKVANNFWIESRIWFFEININILEKLLYNTIKSKDLSTFQENNFDLNFVVEKNIKWNEIKQTIEKTNEELITKVELIDIYENEEKLPNKRSLTFKIFIQSMEKTLDDKDKAKLIEEIIKNVEKKWWILR